MKNKMPVKRNKKYIKKEFTVTREEACPAVGKENSEDHLLCAADCADGFDHCL